MEYQIYIREAIKKNPDIFIARGFLNCFFLPRNIFLRSLNSDFVLNDLHASNHINYNISCQPKPYKNEFSFISFASIQCQIVQTLVGRRGEGSEPILSVQMFCSNTPYGAPSNRGLVALDIVC